MKVYTVQWVERGTSIWQSKVTANSEEEALSKVTSWDDEAVDLMTQLSDNAEETFMNLEITAVKESKEK